MERSKRGVFFIHRWLKIQFCQCPGVSSFSPLVSRALRCNSCLLIEGENWNLPYKGEAYGKLIFRNSTQNWSFKNDYDHPLNTQRSKIEPFRILWRLYNITYINIIMFKVIIIFRCSLCMNLFKMVKLPAEHNVIQNNEARF